MSVDITFMPTVDGGYTIKDILTEQEIEVGSGNAISKVLEIPRGTDALEIQIKYANANRSVKVRIFNSIDDGLNSEGEEGEGLGYETTATEEFEIEDEVQIVKFDRWLLSRYVKLQIEAYTQTCTIDVKARIQL